MKEVQRSPAGLNLYKNMQEDVGLMQVSLGAHFERLLRSLDPSSQIFTNVCKKWFLQGTEWFSLDCQPSFSQHDSLSLPNRSYFAGTLPALHYLNVPRINTRLVSISRNFMSCQFGVGEHCDRKSSWSMQSLLLRQWLIYSGWECKLVLVCVENVQKWLLNELAAAHVCLEVCISLNVEGNQTFFIAQTILHHTML